MWFSVRAVTAMQHRKPKSKPSRSSLLIEGGQRSKMFYLVPVCFLLFGGGLISCGSSTHIGIGGIKIGQFGGSVTKISEIQQNKNATDTVYIQGQVVTRAPFLEAGAYKVQDATGTIWVVTQTLPNVGDEVLIKGQPKFQSVPVGGQDLGEVYVQEEQQLERKAVQPGKSLPSQGNSKS
jgi:hypothetical protein